MSEPRFVVGCSGPAQWVPNPHELVTDTAHGRVGKMVSWDGDLGRLTLRSLADGTQWETTEYRQPNDADKARARAIVFNRDRRKGVH
ncbi:hypothetical protein ACIHFE_18190 [Streptomyces sp. NPDC052396]|uniref:hypothetical protein n=1 Tax=Streptomyces sp. NPDC052396 TaxID=3365689 RepID=UPI0037D005A9